MSEETAVMWVEKYRPKTLNDVVDHREVLESLKAFVKSPSAMPHLLFSGPPGNGKTSVALCMAKQLLGSNWKSYTLELNASDERGIQMVRDRIKTFSRHMTGTLANVPFGIIILDECDQMTSEAQTALRRIMETSSRTSRFILVCNFSSKIIEPIQSRCAIFRFSVLKAEEIINHLKKIANKECVDLQESGIKAILDYCGGDLRRSINTLQATAAFSKVVTERAVLQIVGQANPKEMRNMIEKALSGDFIEARKMLYELMTAYGLSGTDIIRQVHREIFHLNIPVETQLILINLLGEYDFRLTEGANEDIQLSAFLAQLQQFSLEGSSRRRDAKRLNVD
ncbi:MAG: replication factor C small subunit [Candidatus Bathyarchaeota archaeon]